MRVVLESNILVSAMITALGKFAVVNAWLDRKLTLLTCTAHIEELRATPQKPRVVKLIKPKRRAAWSTRSENSSWTSASCRS